MTLDITVLVIHVKHYKYVVVRLTITWLAWNVQFISMAVWLIPLNLLLIEYLNYVIQKYTLIFFPSTNCVESKSYVL